MLKIADDPDHPLKVVEDDRGVDFTANEKETVWFGYYLLILYRIRLRTSLGGAKENLKLS